MVSVACDIEHISGYGMNFERANGTHTHPKSETKLPVNFQYLILTEIPMTKLLKVQCLVHLRSTRIHQGLSNITKNMVWEISM
jgi:hypothetical protein